MEAHYSQKKRISLIINEPPKLEEPKHMETITEEKSNHSTASSIDISVDPESSDGAPGGDDSSEFDDLISEASASSSVFESADITGNTNLLDPIESDGEDEDEDEDDDEYEDAIGGIAYDEEATQETAPADLSAESEENRIIENQLLVIARSADSEENGGTRTDEEEKDNGGTEEKQNGKTYDLGGTYDLGAPVTPSSTKEEKYDLGGEEKKYDLRGKTYDLGSYLSEPKHNAAKVPPSLPSVQNSQSTQHRSGSSAYILHKWMTDRDWNAARTYLSSPDLNHKHLQASIFYKNDDGETSLHIACRKRAPYDIVKLITDIGGVDCVMAVDTYGGSLPLHHACHFHASPDVIKLLVYIGGVESVKLKDAIGNLPLHWALSKDSTFSTIKLLIDIGGHDTINTTNKLGWNSLHAATYFSSKISVVKLLVDIGGFSVVKCINKKGQTPLDILYEKNPFDKDSIQLVQDVMGQDTNLLSWLPPETVDKTMIWVGRQPESVQEKGFQFPFIQMIVNEALMVQRFLCILLLDLFAQVVLVVTLSYSVSMEHWFGYKNMSSVSLCLLIYSIAWLGIRCITQMIASPIYSWIAEFSNWTNGLQTALMVWSILILSQDGIDREYQSVIAIATTGIVWFRLVFVLGELFHSIAVFAAALQRIVSKLIAFAVTSTLVLFGFAHMLYTASELDEEYCLHIGDETNCVNRSLRDSYYTAFTEFFNPSNLIDHEAGLSANSYRTVLIIIFAVLVELLLLNVLVAEIVHSLSDAKKGGKKAFWQKRFLIVSQLRDLYRTVGFCEGKKSDEKRAIEFDEDREQRSKIPTTRYTFSTAIYEAFPGDFYSFRRWWVRDGPPPNLHIRLKYFLSWASVEEILMPGPTFERVVSGGKRDTNSLLARAFLYLIFPFSLLIQCLYFIFGLVSFGYFWPKWMKRALFSGPVDYGNSDIPAVGKHFDILKHEIKSIHNAVKAETFAVTRMEDDMKAIKSDLKMMIKKSSVTSVYSEEDGESEYVSEPGS